MLVQEIKKAKKKNNKSEFLKLPALSALLH